MQAIYEGRKYDTATSELLLSKPMPDNTVFNLYCNKKRAFFIHMVETEKKSGEVSEEFIKPYTKDEAMDCLAKNNAVSQYEKLFGEIPEAEGEDYISQTSVTIEIKTDVKPPQSKEEKFSLSSVEPVQENVIKTRTETSKKSLIQSFLLVIACVNNDFSKAEEYLEKNADANLFKASGLKKAIANENLPLVSLLIESGARLIQYHLMQAVLVGNTNLFKLVMDNFENPDKEKLLNLAKQYKRIYIVDYLNQKMEEN